MLDKPKRLNRQDMLRQALPALRARQTEINRRAKPYKPDDIEVILEHVWERVSAGQILNDVLTDIGLPAQTYFRWLNPENEPAMAAYRGSAHARAKRMLADWAFGEALRKPRDLLAKIELGDKVDNVEVTACRNYVDSLKWYAERLDPKQYGQQKQELKVTGELTHTMQAIPLDVTSLTSEQRDALRLALLATKEQDNQELRESGKLIEARALPSPKPAKE